MTRVRRKVTPRVSWHTRGGRVLEDGFSDPGVQLASDSLSWVEGASGPELDIKTLGKKKKKKKKGAQYPEHRPPHPKWQDLHF